MRFDDLSLSQGLFQGRSAFFEFPQIKLRIDVEKVAFHEVFGGSAIMFAQRINKSVMGVAFAQGIAPPPVERDNQRGTGHELL